VLGHAAIDSKTQTGVLATVFIDRTRRLSGELGIDHRVLLGRTIAHELGHLLLATTTHGTAGLMREAWSRDELLGTRRDDWIFDRSDAEAIRKRLARLRNQRSRGASSLMKTPSAKRFDWAVRNRHRGRSSALCRTVSMPV